MKGEPVEKDFGSQAPFTLLDLFVTAAISGVGASLITGAIASYRTDVNVREEMRREAVKAGVAKWTSDGAGKPVFTWIASEKKP